MKALFFLVCVLFVYTNAETTINFNFDGMIPPLPSCNCNATTYCGDGECNGAETNLTCPNDCTVHVPVCGDRSCDPNETAFSCPVDCSRCGDKLCDNTESLTSCPIDCVACGDGFCTIGFETLAGCPIDCANICGNDVCEAGESFTICPDDCPCAPQCSGRNCGSDGCGSSCGTCSTGQVCSANGVCVCSPSCSGRNCGSDGCGGSCGTCSGNQVCSSSGVCVCSPNCNGRNCGDNGCGGSCGVCTSPQTCNANGVCVDPVCTPNCNGRNCGDNGCGGSCGTCSGNQVCSSGVCVCSPNCNGRNCGDNGCGGSCGFCTSPQTCNANGVCVDPVCTPNCNGRNCGDNGCGGSCGTCSGNQVCSSGVCVCSPNCNGRNCGDNGCGGSCGTCSGSQVCSNGVCVCTPNCAGRVCGSNGCGGSCGTCPTGQICTSVGTCQVPTGTRSVEFTLYQINAGFAAFASGVTVTSSLGSTVSSASGVATLNVATNDTVTFSGAGYQSVSVVVYGSSDEISFLVPPTLTPNEVLVALIWDDWTADLDLHMFGPGDLVYYSSPEGVVNWEYQDKNLSYPFAQWHDYLTPGVIGLEVTTIYQLNYSAIYEFVGYLWSRVDGGDPSYNWENVSASMLVFGGSATGLTTGLLYHADPPVPPAGFDYAFWSPFSFRPDGTGNLDVVEDATPFDPPVSIASIDAGDQQYISCSYAYCPYRLP